MTVGTRIQSRHDTLANWVSANPTLSTGELGFETTTGRLKIGDGATAWSALTSVDLTPVSKSADYTATPGDCVLMTGAHNVTLPSAPSIGTQVNVVALTATTTILRGGSDTLTIGTSSALTTTTVSAGLTLTLQYLSGVWYSVVQSGGGGGSGGGLVTAARMHRAGAWSVFASAKVPFDTATYDPGGNLTIGSSRYVCPTTGYYFVDFQVQASATGSGQTLTGQVYKNNAQAGASIQVLSSASGYFGVADSDVVYCQAGDYLEIFASAGVSMTGSASQYAAFMSVVQVSGPSSPGSTVAAPQTVARAYRAAGLTLTASAWTKMPLDTASYDPGSNLTLASNRYVCPTTGYYQFNGEVNTTSSAGSQFLAVGIYKTGAIYTQGSEAVSPAGALGMLATVTDVVYCQAGDYLELFYYCSAALTAGVSTGTNFMSIVQVAGNALSASLSPTAQSGNYTAQAGQSVIMTGANTVTLPNGPIGGAVVEVVALTGTVTINRAGSDTINARGISGLTTMSILLGTSMELRYLSGVWYVVQGAQPIGQWTAASLGNSWANTGGAYETAGYMKDPLGFVHLKGVVSGGSSGTVAFTLPAGYRPAAAMQPAASNGNGGTAYAFAAISNVGAVTISWGTAGTYIGLSGITFLAEA